MKRRWLMTVTVALLGVVILAWITVPATIIPPAAPLNPVTVYVVESGLHAHLVLPLRDRWIQYEFGDWNYYALNRHGILHGLMALMVPTPGALGRRDIVDFDRSRQRWAQAGYQVLGFEVSAAEAVQLGRSLHHRFEQRALEQQRIVHNAQLGLNLVQDDQAYSLLHNSNHELAEWLEALNCEIERLFLWSAFRLAEPD